MNKLIKIYGKALTWCFVMLVSFWFIFLIAMPQYFMIEQSLWKKELPEQALDAKIKLDRLYNEQSFLKRFDIPEAEEISDEQQKSAKLAILNEELDAINARIIELEKIETEPVKEYTLSNYTEMSGLHAKIFFKSILYSLLVTVLALIVCYPIAYAIAHYFSKRWTAFLMLGVIVPYTINELLRVYSWLMILDYKGVINSLLAIVGVTNLEANQVIPFLESPSSVFLAMVYAYILMMLFPIYNTIETLDKNQINASYDLGANTIQTHRHVIIPHAKPGIAVGCIMTFMLSVGSYSVPHIMSRGKQEKWFSQLIYDKFYEVFNWNAGAAYAFSLLVVCLIFVFIMMKVFNVGIEDIAK